jgi:hypothetical protein
MNVCQNCGGRGGFHVHPGDPRDLARKPCPICNDGHANALRRLANRVLARYRAARR